MSATGAPAMSRTDTAVGVISAWPDRVSPPSTPDHASGYNLTPDFVTQSSSNNVTTLQ